MKKIVFVGVIVLLALLVSGCAQVTTEKAGNAAPENNGAAAAKEGAAMEKEDGAMAKEDGVMVKTEGGDGAMAKEDGAAMQKEGAAMEASFYSPFAKAEYDKARAEGKVVFLEFYANWCPLCSRQKPVDESVFADPSVPKGVAGFQVNYKDSETDADEQELARQFGITYQHTRVILAKGGSLFHKKTGNSEKDEIIGLLEQASAS